MKAIKQYVSTVLFLLVFYVTKFQGTVSVFNFVPRSTLKCMLVSVKTMKQKVRYTNKINSFNQPVFYVRIGMNTGNPKDPARSQATVPRR